MHPEAACGKPVEYLSHSPDSNGFNFFQQARAAFGMPDALITSKTGCCAASGVCPKSEVKMTSHTKECKQI
jgi:hypothetical protein